MVQVDDPEQAVKRHPAAAALQRQHPGVVAATTGPPPLRVTVLAKQAHQAAPASVQARNTAAHPPALGLALPNGSPGMHCRHSRPGSIAVQTWWSNAALLPALHHPAPHATATTTKWVWTTHSPHGIPITQAEPQQRLLPPPWKGQWEERMRRRGLLTRQLRVADASSALERRLSRCVTGCRRLLGSTAGPTSNALHLDWDPRRRMRSS